MGRVKTLSFPHLKHVQFWGILFLIFSKHFKQILNQWLYNSWFRFRWFGMVPFLATNLRPFPPPPPPRCWHWPRFPLKHRRPFVEDQRRFHDFIGSQLRFKWRRKKKGSNTSKKGGGNDFFLRIFIEWCSSHLAKSEYFTNLDFPELRGFPFRHK